MESCPYQEQSAEESEVADPIDDKRLLRRCRRTRPLVPESNQEIAAQSHAFPKNEQQNEVRREHQQAHREYEERKACEKPRVSWIAVHVAGRKHGYQQAHSRH